MLTSNFEYHLPNHLIAKYGKTDRATSRLMCIERKVDAISHDYFQNLPEILTKIFPEKCSLVVNNTKVMKARLYANKSSGKRIELLLLKHAGGNKFTSMIRGRVPLGTTLTLETATVQLLERFEDGTVLLEFSSDPFAVMIAEGHTPLPPYIDRDDTPEDTHAYQTIFANHLGSVASSTASIHFSQHVLAELEQRGIRVHEITLHIGLGTFKPINTDAIDDYSIHSEYYEITPETAHAINMDKAEGRKVVCVGSTSVRALESNALLGGTNPHTSTSPHTSISSPHTSTSSPHTSTSSPHTSISSPHTSTSSPHTSTSSPLLTPYAGETSLYITPGFRFRVADAIITNFHMPRTTLLVMMSAFYGREQLLEAYGEAIREQYKFYSYGDAMIMY